MDLIDSIARSGVGTGGPLSPFLPSFTKDRHNNHNQQQNQYHQQGDKGLHQFAGKAFLDSYFKALSDPNNPSLFYGAKYAGDNMMMKHHVDIAADDAEYSSASDEEEEDDGDDSVNDAPIPPSLQAGKN